MEQDNPSGNGFVPLSEVGFEGLNPPEEIVSGNMNQRENISSVNPSNFLSGMESILTRLLAATQNVTNHSSTPQLIKFDPDDAEADIEGWCKITDIIVTNRKLSGPELLLALIHSLKGRAASCLTKLKSSDIEWPQIKEMLLAKFGKPMLMQDYFDDVMRFEIATQETASEAAMRLWNIVERIPKVDMPEDVITGFVISVLSQRNALIRRELNSFSITTRTQLCRILSGVSLKRRHEDNEDQVNSAKRARTSTDTRFSGSCHYCGSRGHKIEECRKRRDGVSRPKAPEKERTVVCFACLKPGHLSTSCPNKTERDQAAKKEVNVCERKLTKGILSTSTGKTISFLFDSGSACSLVKDSLVVQLPGCVRNDLVYLTGIGGNDIKNTTQILSSVQIQNCEVSILFHVVPADAISDSIIVGSLLSWIIFFEQTMAFLASSLVLKD